MTDKITKQRMYCELVIRMEKLENKLDKLIHLLQPNISTSLTVEAGPTDVDSLVQTIKANIASELLDYKLSSCQDVTPHCIEGTGPCKCSGLMAIQDSEEFDGAYK